MNTYFNYEIYIYNQEKTISGWEIVTVAVKADNSKEAKDKLKKYPLYDCIITSQGYEQIESEEDFILHT